MEEVLDAMALDLEPGLVGEGARMQDFKAMLRAKGDGWQGQVHRGDKGGAQAWVRSFGS